ncbi:hypothetical protein B0H13DRAFT_1907710 [Mycena leptocephala]|nr:hypothetical protein B0H13DRAFT_1907710 [Mycena leptocephala]
MQDFLALDRKTSSRPLCSSKKLDAFKNSIRKTPRVSDIKSLQPFHAQDPFGIGRAQQDPSRLPAPPPGNYITGDGLHVQYVAGRATRNRSGEQDSPTTAFRAGLRKRGGGRTGSPSRFSSRITPASYFLRRTIQWRGLGLPPPLSFLVLGFPPLPLPARTKGPFSAACLLLPPLLSSVFLYLDFLFFRLSRILMRNRMYRTTTAPSGAGAAAANVRFELLTLPARISSVRDMRTRASSCAGGGGGAGATACVHRGYSGALLARDPLAEGEAGVLVMMAGAWDASENAQRRLYNASVLDAQSTGRRTCAVRWAWLDRVESAAHTPIHWWNSEHLEVGGSMRADVRAGVREAGVCETAGTVLECSMMQHYPGEMHHTLSSHGRQEAAVSERLPANVAHDSSRPIQFIANNI